nr:MAG TPA: hypothetical protein [Caudoviricetes sp.]
MQSVCDRRTQAGCFSAVKLMKHFFIFCPIIFLAFCYTISEVIYMISIVALMYLLVWILAALLFG